MSSIPPLSVAGLAEAYPMATTPSNSPGGINGASGTTGASNASGSANTTTQNGALSAQQLNQLSNPQLFLQLLVAELQNQDPTNPMSPQAILSQTASLSQMEAINSMVSAINGEQSSTQATQAAGLLGQTVTASVHNSSISGTVSEVKLSATGAPTLVVNGTDVPLSSVTSLGATPASTGAGATVSATPSAAGAASGNSTSMTGTPSTTATTSAGSGAAQTTNARAGAAGATTTAPTSPSANTNTAGSTPAGATSTAASASNGTPA